MPRSVCNWFVLFLVLPLLVASCGDDDDSPTPPQARPDLAVLAITFNPASPTTNDAVTASVTVKNNGDASSSGCAVAVQVDGTTSCGAVQVGGLSSGQMQTVSCDLGLLTAGGRSVQACVDAGSTVAESDETNNCLTQTVTVTTEPPPAAPDLVVQSITFSPAQPTPFQTVTAAITVHNAGNQAVPATTLRTSVDGTIACAAVAVPAIPAGLTQTVTCDLGTLSTGDRQVEACADAGSEVEESNENNNCRVQGLEVSAAGFDPPDLPIPELLHPVDFCNLDPWAQQAQSLVQGQVAAAAAIASLGPAIVAGIESAEWQNEGGGCWTAPYTDEPGCTGEYGLCQVVGGYEFILTVTGTCYEGTVTDWKAYDGFISQDGTEGRANFYALNTTTVETAFEWRVTADGASGAWSWYEGAIHPDNRTYQMEFEEQSDGSLEIEWVFEEQMRWMLDVSADGKIGTMDTYLWGEAPPGWVLETAIVWDDCTGSWTSYAEGEIEDQYSW